MNISLRDIEKIILQEMKSSNAFCCMSINRILKKIQGLDWENKDVNNNLDTQSAGLIFSNKEQI